MLHIYLIYIKYISYPNQRSLEEADLFVESRSAPSVAPLSVIHTNTSWTGSVLAARSELGHSFISLDFSQASQRLRMWYKSICAYRGVFIGLIGIRISCNWQYRSHQIFSKLPIRRFCQICKMRIQPDINRSSGCCSGWPLKPPYKSNSQPELRLCSGCSSGWVLDFPKLVSNTISKPYSRTCISNMQYP